MYIGVGLIAQRKSQIKLSIGDTAIELFVKQPFHTQLTAFPFLFLETL